MYEEELDYGTECSELEDGYDMKSYYSDTDSNNDGYQYEREQQEEEMWTAQEEQCNDTESSVDIPILINFTSPYQMCDETADTSKTCPSEGTGGVSGCFTSFECSICFTNRCQGCSTRKCSVCIHVICTSCWVKVDRCPYCRSVPLKTSFFLGLVK